MSPGALDIGFQEDLRGVVDACGLGGRDSWERVRAWCAGEGRGLVESRGAKIEPRFPELLAAWIEQGCPRARAATVRAFFTDLDGWTDRWQDQHPETRGRFSFGDGRAERGARATLLQPGGGGVAPFRRWTEWATSHRESWGERARAQLVASITEPRVREAVLSLDLLLCHLYRRHFGSLPSGDALPVFLDGMHRYAKGELGERVASPDDQAWFVWAFVLEAAELLGAGDGRLGMRRVWMAALVVGAATDAVVSRRFRTRTAYAGAPDLTNALHRRGRAIAADFVEGCAEMRDLYLIRTFGEQQRAPAPPHLEGAA